MKLRNLMYATMIACAFASCSKDDEVIDNGGATTKTDATLAVKIEAPSLTKAVGEPNKGDADISNLTVYVFDATGAYETSKTVTSSTVDEQIPVSAGQKSIVVVANATLGQPANIGALYSSQVSIANEKNGLLSMNSKTYTVTIVAGKTNYLGYTTDDTGVSTGVLLTDNGTSLQGGAVKLYRNVAKVVLSSIKADTQNTGLQTKYPNAKFKVTGVFMLHGHANALAVGGATAWALTEVPVSESSLLQNGIDNDMYGTTWHNIVKNLASTDLFQNYVTSSSYEHFAQYDNATEPFTLNANEAETTSSVDSFYVYENSSTDVNTLLVVKGKFMYGNESPLDEHNFPERYYSVAIGKDGYTPGNQTIGGVTRNIKYVVRNMQYNINLTVKGPGYETPFGPGNNADTYLNVKVDVVPFGTVSQTPVIE